MAIKQGNEVCVMGCPKNTSSGLRAYSIFKYMKQKCYDKEKKNYTLYLSHYLKKRVNDSGCTSLKNLKTISIKCQRLPFGW